MTNATVTSSYASGSCTFAVSWLASCHVSRVASAAAYSARTLPSLSNKATCQLSLLVVVNPATQRLQVMANSRPICPHHQPRMRNQLVPLAAIPANHQLSMPTRLPLLSN